MSNTDPTTAAPTSAQPTDQPPLPINSASPKTVARTPGWKTTEFWMTSLSHIGLLLAATAGALPPQYAAIAIAASQVAYNLSRGMAKQNASSFAPFSVAAAN